MTLTREQQVAITAAVELLESHGSALGRLLVERVVNAPYRDMRALHVPTEKIRVLFTFDPARNVLVLLGGEESER